jgi:hypothetical protein
MAHLLPSPAAPRAAAAALGRWSLRVDPTTTAATSPDAGLINTTLLVGAPPVAVLQWVNPLFSPLIHLDIALLLERLRDAGMTCPTLLPADDGALWQDADHGCWRLWSFVPGTTLHRVSGPAVAAEAGALVGRLHAATAGWTPPRHAPLRHIHDTPARMAELEAALAGAEGHPLAAAVRALGAQILGDWAAWQGALDEPARIGHGDLKISNLRFDAAGKKAVCLLDLDTVGPITLGAELGDAWRSWCNPLGEDTVEDIIFDMEVFEASADGFLSTGPDLDRPARAALAHAPERIALELAARFCRDAVLNSYFREDRARFPTTGAHNLHRARVQAALARAARAAAPAAARALTGG